MESVELKGNTDTGKKRQDNQDTFIAMKIWGSDKALIGVIDGVGGYEGGDRAAAIAKESIEQYMSSPKGDVLSMLKEAVIFANNSIAEERGKDPKLSQMCCVLTVAVADAKTHLLHYVHVGDTRLYRLREGILEKITKDHSFVGIQEDAGEITEEQAMQHPNRNLILRQVGSEFHRIDDPEFLESGETEFVGGDIVLVCSDGLTDMITKAQMLSVLDKQTDLGKKLTELIALANEIGGEDNITVVLAKNKQKVKPSHKRRQTPAFKDPMPSTPVHEEARAVSKKKKSTPGQLFAGFLMIALLLALIYWVINKEEPGSAIKNESTPAVTDTTQNKKPEENITAPTGNNGTGMPAKFNIDSLIVQVKANKGKELSLDQLEDTDTIILSNTLDAGKIGRITGGATKKVLQPSSMLKNGPAITIYRDSVGKKPDTVLLKNLLIKGFETGILVRGKIIVKLDNVSFDAVKYPVSYSVSTDSSKITTIYFQQ
jgi:serine/threonine protein phosphatase PrpC